MSHPNCCRRVCLAGSVGSSVVVENAYAFAQHSSSPVLNRPPEFYQRLTIPVRVYCGASSHEIDQQYPLSIPKHSCHDFTGRICLIQFSRLRRRGMQQLTWMLFRLRCEMVCPGFIACDNLIHKVILFVLLAAEKFMGRIHTLPFVVFCQHSWNPSCAHLLILQLIRQNRTNGGSWNLRNRNAEMIQWDPPIFTHGFLNIRDRLVANWRSSAAFFVVNLSTTKCKLPTPLLDVLISMHDSPYTSVNWLWISIGVLPFAFKNRITERTSHFAVMLGGEPHYKRLPSQANCPIPVCARLDGVGEWGKQHM